MTKDKFEHGHCPACGSPLDAEGICTKKTCPRRRMQVKLKKLREAVEQQSNQGAQEEAR